jgi:hypothetical protein
VLVTEASKEEVLVVKSLKKALAADSASMDLSWMDFLQKQSQCQCCWC